MPDIIFYKIIPCIISTIFLFSGFLIYSMSIHPNSLKKRITKTHVTGLITVIIISLIAEVLCYIFKSFLLEHGQIESSGFAFTYLLFMGVLTHAIIVCFTRYRANHIITTSLVVIMLAQISAIAYLSFLGPEWIIKRLDYFSIVLFLITGLIIGLSFWCRKSLLESTDTDSLKDNRTYLLGAFFIISAFITLIPTHNIISVVAALSSCFLTAYFVSQYYYKNPDIRLITNSLISLSFFFIAIDLTYIVALISGIVIVPITIITRHLLTKYRILDKSEINLIIFSSTIAATLFYLLQANYYSLLISLAITLDTAFLIVLATFVLGLVIPTNLNKSYHESISLNQFKSGILKSKKIIIIPNESSLSPNNFNALNMFVNNLSKAKKIIIGIHPHLLTKENTVLLEKLISESSSYDQNDNVILTDINDINNAIHSCDMQILLNSNNNKYSSLSKKRDPLIPNDEILMTHEAKNTVILNSSKKLFNHTYQDDNNHHIQTLNMKLETVLMDDSFGDLTTLIKEKTKHHLILITGFIALALLTLISVFTFPKFTAHLALFGLLALLSFNITSKIPPTLHTPVIAWSIIPSSIVIIMCIPFTDTPNTSLLIISYVMLLLFLVNLILSCGITINNRVLKMLRPTKKKRSKRMK